jgi:sugar-specific transcriptional regulator TrmB
MLQGMETEYQERKRDVIKLGALLSKIESQRNIHLDPVYTISMNEILEELRALLQVARKHVWICKRTSGGLIDWFVLKEELIRLSKTGVDIRFLGDTKVQVGFPSRMNESASLSFVIIDSTAMSFFFENCPKNSGRAIVTDNSAFVEFLNSTFLEWWRSGF